MAFAIFGILSALWLVFSAVYVWGHYKNTANGKRLPVLSLFTACFFISVWLFLIPINYAVFDIEGSKPITALILSLLNTLQVFLTDGSTDTYNLISEYAVKYIPAVQTVYTLYAALIIAAAPILTLGNVLMMFREFAEDMRFAFSGRKRVYIMSQLNNCSVTLAESIITQDEPSAAVRQHGKKLIVFTDVNDDTEIELILAAREMNAVILKKAVTELDLANLKRQAELFFISDDENENITRALSVTNDLNERGSKQEIKIFAFAHSRASGCVIDSAEYGKLLNKEQFLSDGIDFGNIKYTPPEFRIRRVDIIRQFVWNEITKMGFFDGMNKDVSVLVVGFGAYGLEFFKALSWFCQFDGRKLEINIIDKNPDIRSTVSRYCPGLLTVNAINPYYSVECFSDTDLETDKFAALMSENSERAERLKRTTHAVIALGSDDADTEAAIYLRELFERAALSEAGTPAPKMRIYAVLYDEHLCSSPQSRTLINYKDTPYDINFIGGLSAKYLRSVVYDEAVEMEAFREHADWIVKNSRENSVSPEEQREDYIRSILDYEKFEYYRLSSISKAMYKKALGTYLNGISEDEKRDKELNKNEHDRWQLYMCANGYVYGKDRNDLAKVHDRIVHYDNMPESEKCKDEYAKNK